MGERGGGVDCKVIREVEWVGFVDSLRVGGEERAKEGMTKVASQALGGVDTLKLYIYIVCTFLKNPTILNPAN